MDVLLDPILLETLGTLLAAALTVMGLSYIIGDNAFFRLAAYLFVGVAGGFAATVAWHEVLEPRLLRPLLALDAAGLGGGSLFSGGLVPAGLVVPLALPLVAGARLLGGLPGGLLVG